MNKKKTPNKSVAHSPVLMHNELKDNVFSPIPNDGTFIEETAKHDGFASINTVRYGEEADADDL